jgi:sugar/nucleoside kinase (ribokinase family)
VVFATYVGADELGRFVARGMARRGLYGRTTLVCAAQPRAMVLYDRDGRRAGATDLRCTPDLHYPVATFEAAVDGSPCAAAVLTNIGFTRPLLGVASERGIPIVTDLHLVAALDDAYNADWMSVAHVLACSHERLPVAPAHWVRAVWRRFGTELVLVGCGRNGAVVGVRATGRIWHVPACAPRGVRYTSGAGDTLLASFVHHWITTGDPLDATRQGVLTAGWKVGASPDDEPGVPVAQLAALRHRFGLPAAVRLR